MTIRSIAIIGAVVASAASFAAVAPANANIPQAHVSYRDLNLNSHVGQQVLARRVSSAATQVCGSDDAGSRFAVAACRQDAIKQAQVELQKAGVAAL
jgi:UrcA family protein